MGHRQILQLFLVRMKKVSPKSMNFYQNVSLSTAPKKYEKKGE